MFHDFLSSADFLSKSTFSENSFRNIIKVAKGLDPDHDRRNVAQTGCKAYRQTVADPEVRWNPLPAPVFKYPMKMK